MKERAELIIEINISVIIVQYFGQELAALGTSAVGSGSGNSFIKNYFKIS